MALPVRIKPSVTLSLIIVTDNTSDGGCDDDCPSSFNAGGLDDDPRSIDDLFDTIAKPRTRYVLSHLESISVNVVELDDLVDNVAEREVETGLAVDPEEHRRRVAIALHHNHLPKLAEAAVIDYDSRSKTVRYWGDDRIPACLELFDSSEST